MSAESQARRRSIFAYAVVACFSLLGIFGLRKLAEGERSSVDRVVDATPHLAALASFEGRGFGARSEKGFQTMETGEKGLRSSAPVRANGTFRVETGTTLGPALDLTLVDAHSIDGESEEGVVAYEGALPGGDLITVAEPARMELFFVVKDARAFSSPVLQVETPRDGDRAELTRDGSLLVRSKSDRPVLALSRPVALDARGKRREGRYHPVAEGMWQVALSLDGLTAPIVIDPSVHVPHWTLLDDGSQPGARIFNVARGSRLHRVAYDVTRGKIVLIRPSRIVQSEDLAAPMGDPLHSPEEVRGGAGPGAKAVTAAERARWTSTYQRESETWIRDGARWERLSATGLPGYVDPSLTYVPALGGLVAYGGAPSKVVCSFSANSYTWTECSPLDRGWPHVLGEGGWEENRAPGAPQRRLRPAAGRFGNELLVFGGRIFPASYKYIDGEPRGSTDFRNLSQPNYYPEAASERRLSNDTYLFDGLRWKRVQVQNPPPATENAQLIFDERRGRSVLVGGSAEGVGDALSLHEFDGTDWVEVATQESGNLPRDLQGRTDMSAFWHPLRKTVMLFGGNFTSLSICPLSDEEVSAQLGADPQSEQSLREAGCLGGYAHDLWEWNGTELTRLSGVAFAGYDEDVAVFSQIGNYPWANYSTPNEVSGQPSAQLGPRLLAERFDSRQKHFLLRSSHERTFEDDRAIGSISPILGGVGSGGDIDEAFRSPVFAAPLRMDAVFDATTGEVVLVHPKDGRVIRTNGQAWLVESGDSPFSEGPTDFIASTWDSVAKRVVVFEPQQARTWVNDGSSWTQVITGIAPPAVPEIPRIDDDLPHYDQVYLEQGTNPRSSMEFRRNEILLQTPKMAFDTARNRAVMIHADSLWEFSGSQWNATDLPSDLVGCDASTLMAYDANRERTVVTGCRVPAQTWEWDGVTWTGPGPTPFVARIQQWEGTNFSTAAPVVATAEMDWTHPDSLFYSPSQEGVALVDNDGHLRVWDGSEWKQGARLYDQYELRYPWMGETKNMEFGSSQNLGLYYPRLRPFGPSYGADRPLDSYLPTVFYPPGFEDPNSHNVVIFRDQGSSGMRELRAADNYSAWHATEPGGDGIYPFPRALLGVEHIHVRSSANPDTATGEDGAPYERANYLHSKASNLLWPFRIFVDAETERVRMMTHRGEVWEIGSETTSEVGDTCSEDGDCASGHCVEGYCCESACASLCSSCAGDTPGLCRSVGIGQPEPHGWCGEGQCAASCGRDDFGQAVCAYAPGTPCGEGPSCEEGIFTPAASCEYHYPEGTFGPRKFGCVQPASEEIVGCDGGLTCDTDTNCKTSCLSRADCSSRFEDCNLATGQCVPDAVSELANSMGIEPARVPKELVPKTLEEVADALRELGIPEVDGVFVMPGSRVDDHELQFDPQRLDPFVGLNYCVRRILFCSEQQGTLDECVADNPRCATETPWNGQDPAGLDCCPEECLTTYLTNRNAGDSPAVAISRFVKEGCYPGLE